MPRKYFRKYLPSHESIKANRLIGGLGSWLHHHNLWHLHRRSVAGGAAVGLFAGLIPGPVQMIFAAIFAVIFRVNLPVAVLLTWYTNPFTIVPLYLAAYKIGMWATGDRANGSLQEVLHLEDKSFSAWMTALVDGFDVIGKPFGIGLLLLALLLSATGYILVRGGWRLYVVAAWRKRRTRPHNGG
ncbi:MAG: DUF2062 domain-containing protein [Burkholderiales bacterium]|nr:DUF2062 domain-containing protein [Burkholderiales bacterium]